MPLQRRRLDLALPGAELDAAARRRVRVNLTDLRCAWRTTLGVAAPDTIVLMHKTASHPFVEVYVEYRVYNPIPDLFMQRPQ